MLLFRNALLQVAKCAVLHLVSGSVKAVVVAIEFIHNKSFRVSTMTNTVL